LDPLVLKLSSIWASRIFWGKVDRVLSAETIGVPFATSIALRLEADLVLARKSPESPRRDYVRGEAGEPPFNVKVFYIPRDRLPPGSRVLLVDDLARTGVTFEALARAASRAGAHVVGAVVIIAVGGEWRERLARVGVRDNVYALVELG
jgi:adenine phosphoribosyltransferase